MKVIKDYYPNMIRQFNSLGFSYSYLDKQFKEFIEYCDSYYPKLETITKECAISWIYSKECKSKKVLNDRIVAIKHFSEYLNSIGVESYIPSIFIGYDNHKPISLLNDKQLKEFMRYSDSITACKSTPNREYIVPVLFRLIYACGLRNSEAANIKMTDINLPKGIINIIHSKGDKDRVVYMDESLRKLCVKFNNVQSNLYPDREYFFTIPGKRKRLTKHNIDDLFDKVLSESGLKDQFVIKPTVHGLRHLFAVNNLRKWMESNENIDVNIKYLSQYMGHDTVDETLYYLHMFQTLLPTFKDRMSALTKDIGVSYEEF